MKDSYRRTFEPGGPDDEGSTAGASGAGDLEPTRLERHINAAEFWVNQAGIYDFPNAARTECLQLASIHAALAQALRGTDVISAH